MKHKHNTKTSFLNNSELITHFNAHNSKLLRGVSSWRTLHNKRSQKINSQFFCHVKKFDICTLKQRQKG